MKEPQWWKRAVRLTLVVFLAGLSGCDSNDEPLTFPTSRVITELAWLPDGMLYALTAGDSVNGPEVWQTSRDQGPSEVDLTPILGCEAPVTISSIFSYGELLGVAGRCDSVAGSGVSVVVIDPRTWRDREVLLEYPAALRDITFSGSVDHGYGEVYIRRCRMLVRLRPGGPEVLRLADVDGGRLSLQADVTVRDPSDENTCVAHESVGWPALAKDQELFLFAATDGAAGLSGGARENAPMSLYVGDRDGTAASHVLPELTHLTSLALSPDGSLLAATVGGSGGPGGVILVERETGEQVKAAEGNYFQVAFSPDGDSLAAVYYPGEGIGRQLSVIDLTRYG